RYLILSVGTGRLQRPSRALVRRALALASYVSFRDARSRELVGDPAFAAAPVVPDLAYSLPIAAAPPLPARPDAPAAVGVSPMSYGDPRSWPVAELARDRRHVATMTAFVVRLARAGHPVLLYVTDGPDGVTLDEVRAQALAQLAPEERARVRAVPPGTGLDGLMRALAE